MSVLRRFKMAMLLNVLGLSIAFAAFILIMMQVEYDRNFDRGYTDTESIFRVEIIQNDGDGQAIVCRPWRMLSFNPLHILSQGHW